MLIGQRVRSTRVCQGRVHQPEPGQSFEKDGFFCSFPPLSPAYLSEAVSGRGFWSLLQGRWVAGARGN